MFCIRFLNRVCLFVAAVLLMAMDTRAQPMRPPELPTPSAPQAGAEPGYLGMVADDRQEHGGGIRVKDVDPDSPAAKGGLQADDLITAINGQATHSLDDLKSILGTMPAGAQVKIQVQRQGAAQEVEVTLGRRPPPDQRRFQFGRIPDEPAEPGSQSANDQMPGGGNPSAGNAYAPSSASPSMPGGMAAPRMGAGLFAAPGRPLLGVRTLPVTPQDQMRLGLSSTAGAHVMARTLGSPAEKANIPLDSVITAVNGMAVGTPNDLSALLARAGAGSEVELTYMYNGKPMSAKITLASAGAGFGMNYAQTMPAPVPTLPQAQTQLPLPPPPVPGQQMLENKAQRGYGSLPGAVDIAHPEDVSPRPIDAQPRPLDAPPRPLDAPPHSSDAQAGQTDAQRIEALERRVQELEQKVQELQGQLQQQQNGPPKGT
ncbi:MAG TPA: PDZ domain-containing protein [Pirellulales bacterium]|nr:PDZ domain-containing protein [Pirellulales bacterium]